MISRTCSTNGDSTNAYTFLVGKRQWKRPLERLRRRWDDDIKMFLKNIGCESVEWIHLSTK
jgi:hypothetical protein